MKINFYWRAFFLFFSSAAFSEVHYIEVKKRENCTTDIQKRLEFQSKKMNERGGKLQRIAFFDFAHPTTPKEYQQSGKNGVLMVTGISRSSKDFPFSIRINQEQLQGYCYPENIEVPIVQKIYGKHQQTCLFRVPINQLTKKGAMQVLWSKEDQLPLAKLPLKGIPSKLIKLAKDDANSSQVSFDELIPMLDRRYCIEEVKL